MNESAVRQDAIQANLLDRGWSVAAPAAPQSS
jgi:hypothetical protein